MKKFTYLAFASLCLATYTPSFARTQLWGSFLGKAAPTANPKPFLPIDYKVVTLDQSGIKALLATAGTDESASIKVSIPTPDGTFRTFSVWNTPVLDTDLQNRYPEIQTYSGVATNDATVTVKMSATPMGFFAQVFSYNKMETFAIEPYGFDANGYYTVAYTKDLQALPNHNSSCNPEKIQQLVTGEKTAIAPPETGKTAARTNGNVRHTYRLAMACTGEYSQLVTGSTVPTVSQVLSIITATINNANAVWEREVSISLKLISNTTSVIYLDGNADPYTDNDNPTALGENQTNVNNVIGAANYDIGHIFNTAGGGLAALSSTCSAGSKASGVSGSSGPSDIGTVIHEVGHQLGAGHTFTSKAGGCDGNGMAESSYEPGSGTSIMSYNGACAADNTPSVVTDYYNQFNLGQMRTFITTTGSSCGTTAVGQAPVTMANLDVRYIIPANTPFELIAPEAFKTVNSNSTTTYCWEQSDKGPIDMVEANGATVTVGPIFSSLDPDTSRIRVFPSYQLLSTGLYTSSGARLPNVTRNMTFKVTARSIATDGWGTHNTIDSVLKIKSVRGSMGDFRVLTPSSNVTWTPGQKYTVTWNKANTLTATDSIMTGFVNIYLSKDGGLTFPIILATNVENDGSFDITAPDLYTTKARIKIKAVGNVFFDVSHTDFKINGTPTSVKNTELNNSISVFPNPATQHITIKNEQYNGETLEVQMLNVLGQRVWSGNMKAQLNISVDQMGRGAYYIHIQNLKEGKFGVKQIVLQ
ncbi:reprolysin-like metallopeptidase [Taibaiella sp. KBW10]|uniref:reprolysin-like metallopeptidase n=1 Tax=Taibaiella sp. KBW10 TaxID=2153357 RepID=UPI0013150950|nr:zinc-dependent metalloprotease family protein [Taibaiella sp. KBW10]